MIGYSGFTLSCDFACDWGYMEKESRQKGLSLVGDGVERRPRSSPARRRGVSHSFGNINPLRMGRARAILLLTHLLVTCSLPAPHLLV